MVDTQIRYLELVRGDLEEAGRRETVRRRRPAPRDRRPGRVLVAASVVTLVIAGAIGWWVRTGGISFDSASEGGGGAAGATGGPAPATGATGATAGNDGRYQALLPALGTPAPQPSSVVDEHSGAVVGGIPPNDVSRVIRTARIALVIPRDSFEDRFAQAADVASESGGFVATSTTRKRSGTLTIRVPAADFDQALRSLRDLGEVDVQSIEGRDVTADYVDLQARLRIAKARRQVLLRLMDRATTIAQTIRVQNALDDTQLRIEQVQGQINLLDDRTALATIQVDLREQGVQAARVEKASIPNAFERAVAGFVGVIAGIVIGLGYLLPVLLIGLVAWFLAVRLRRRRVA
jgi:hypothetical protein